MAVELHLGGENRGVLTYKSREGRKKKELDIR